MDTFYIKIHFVSGNSIHFMVYGLRIKWWVRWHPNIISILLAGLFKSQFNYSLSEKNGDSVTKFTSWLIRFYNTIFPLRRILLFLVIIYSLELYYFIWRHDDWVSSSPREFYFSNQSICWIKKWFSEFGTNFPLYFE